jgi:hypothetical protein
MELQVDMPQLQDLACIYTPLTVFNFLAYKEAFHDEALFDVKDRLYLRAQRVQGSRANSAMLFPFEFPSIGETLKIDQAWFEDYASAEIPENMIREFLQSDFNSAWNSKGYIVSDSTSRNTRSRKPSRQT